MEIYPDSHDDPNTEEAKARRREVNNLIDEMEARRSEVNALINSRAKFTEGGVWGYHPILRTRTMGPRRRFTRRTTVVITEIKLEPIAFKSDIVVTDTEGDFFIHGDLSAYLALHPDGRVMQRTGRYSIEGDQIWSDIPRGSLSDEDVENIRIATSGDNERLMEQFLTAKEAALEEYRSGN